MVATGPRHVETVSPASGRSGVSGSAQIMIATAVTSTRPPSWPVLQPAVRGKWTSSDGDVLFVPSGAWPPATTVRVTLPSDWVTTGSAVLRGGRSWSFVTRSGSTLRLQQLLAYLGYLPVGWRPLAAGSGPTGAVDRLAAQRAVFQPPPGVFGWRWTSTPSSLRNVWRPGVDTVAVRGAVMAFESDHHLAVDGIAGAEVWSALVASSTPGAPAVRNANGYSYALASKVQPEHLTVWHDGRVLTATLANTGIPAAPTADGTFPVYERLATQVMRGKNPDGSRYADPVAWVAYFNGGDAVHYIGRVAYGYPQSLGCVEIPYDVGQLIWPYLTLGTLVTVAG
jgi:peptidoglycan hydrolase-like protein with peptidoglycan-binding domain